MIVVNLVHAQRQDLRLIYSPTKFVQHSQKATFPTPTQVTLLQASLITQTQGSKSWQKYWGNPKLGTNFSYFDYGNPDILGFSYGLTRSIGWNLLDRGKHQLSLELGLGLTYITRRYDKLHNPLNSAIGSHLNNLTQIQLSYSYTLTPYLGLELGGHFSHASNAKTVTPNSGINSTGMYVGLSTPLSRPKNNLTTSKDSIKQGRRLGLDVLAGRGFSQYSFTGGYNYATYFGSLGAYYKVSPFLHLIAGGEYEYSQSVFQFYYEDFDPADVARRKASNSAVFVATELLFGQVGFRVQSGYYLPYPSMSAISSDFYIKLNFNYFFLPTSYTTQPYIGVLMKTHLSVAQYFGLVVGVRM